MNTHAVSPIISPTTYGPGNYTIPVPANATSVAFVIWGGGAGGSIVLPNTIPNPGGGAGAIISIAPGFFGFAPSTTSLPLTVGNGGLGSIGLSPQPVSGDPRIGGSTTLGNYFASGGGTLDTGIGVDPQAGGTAIFDGDIFPPPGPVLINGPNAGQNLNNPIPYPPTTINTISPNATGGGAGYGANGGSGLEVIFPIQSSIIAGGGSLGSGGGGIIVNAAPPPGSPSIMAGNGGDGGAVVAFYM